MKKFILMVLLMFSVLPCLAAPLSFSSATDIPPGGMDAWVLAPIGAVEFNPSRPSNYGLSFTESFGLARLFAADANHVVVSPYGFVGVFAAADIGNWVQTNGGAPWSLDYGFMFGLPKLDETLPEVAFSVGWNSLDGRGASLFVDAAFPADIFPSALVKVVK